ncbi:MAG: 30S ribosomal protein S1 [Janthinobacterium lividum]
MSKFKKRFVPQYAEDTENTENFDELLNNISTSNIKEGTVVKAQIVGVTKDVIIVDVGLKSEGRIPVEEFALSRDQLLPEVGDVVDVYIEKIEGRNGRTLLSREKAIREESWIHLEVACAKGEFVDGVIFGRVKGGFTVDLSGVVAFLPGGQLDVKPLKDISSKDINALMGITQPFQILKMDKKLGNIVVSRRAILKDSRAEARDAMLAQIKEGLVLEGIVKNITDYGAFVDLGDVDGLVHVTDISWSRINHPSEVLSIGQKIKVKIIKFNEESKRISLGMKQLDENPWQGIQSEFPAGKVMTGKVTNIADYGAFIELKDGIEGLVHSSEISWLSKSNQNSKKLLTIGQEVKFTILEVDTEKHRISLSIKQCQENPLTKFAENNAIGTVIKAPIRNITDFGMFVALDDNIDGMIHESDISWEGNNSAVMKSFNKGDIVECKVLSIDVDKERISLGIKQLTEDTNSVNMDDIKKNKIVTCEVIGVSEDGVEVVLEDKVQGFIKKVDLSSEKADQKPEKFAKGDRIDAKIISVDKQLRKVMLSIKAYEIEEREKAIKEYGSTDSGARLGIYLKQL